MGFQSTLPTSFRSQVADRGRGHGGWAQPQSQPHFTHHSALASLYDHSNSLLHQAIDLPRSLAAVPAHTEE
jgi:hypothetical protein